METYRSEGNWTFYDAINFDLTANPKNVKATSQDATRSQFTM